MTSEAIDTNVFDRYPSSPVSDARASISQLVDKVRTIGERHVLTRHGRPVAAVVGLSDLRTLEVAHEHAREAMNWPDDDIGADEVEATPIAASAEVLERVEFEDLVRQTLGAVKHDDKLRTMMVEFLEQDDLPTAADDADVAEAGDPALRRKRPSPA